jgi:spore coat protein U-like protein
MHVYTHASTPELATLNDAMPSTEMVVDMADCMPSTSEAVDFGTNDDDKSSITSTPPFGLSMDESC